MYKTVSIFFISPTKEHYLMDISKRIGLAHTSVKKNLVELLKLGIIIESKDIRGERKFPLYRADTESKTFKRYKKIYNITSIMESGLIEFLEERLMPKSIVLFGSYQRGEDIEDSDIDIFIECKEEDIDLKKFEKRLCRKIQLHFRKDFSLYPNELKNNIMNGIVVFGFLEGYK
jgi:predicted nucleotidyltransferase